MNAKTFSLHGISSRLLSRFLENRIVAEEPVLGGYVVDALEESQSVRPADKKPLPSLQMSESLQIPQIGVL